MFLEPLDLGQSALHELGRSSRVVSGDPSGDFIQIVQRWRRPD